MLWRRAISRRLAVLSFLRRPPIATLRPSGSGAGRGSLPNRRALELRERADHLHHHAARRGAKATEPRERCHEAAKAADYLHALLLRLLDIRKFSRKSSPC
jgi:hypothetical protein